jgi:hypothetical protein
MPTVVLRAIRHDLPSAELADGGVGGGMHGVGRAYIRRSAVESRREFSANPKTLTMGSGGFAAVAAEPPTVRRLRSGIPLLQSSNVEKLVQK